ncbi:pseudouridylate synthase [marine gamma proteobacterium HTCC2080]|nr:pseudouridylate synthase [marine gamma proteobacterium HTCC2080]
MDDDHWPSPPGCKSIINQEELGLPDIILLNKPFRVLSQFSDRDNDPPRLTLANLLSAPEFRVAGRLDYDSEGLTLLTDDGKLQQQIANPKFKVWKTYWVQVEGAPKQQAIEQLTSGVVLNDGLTKPAKVRAIDPPDLWERSPSVRFRAHIPDAWLEISIQEGRNRQIRRMTAAVNLPTLRLVRIAIGDWEIGNLQPGEYVKHSIGRKR